MAYATGKGEKFKMYGKKITLQNVEVLFFCRKRRNLKMARIFVTSDTHFGHEGEFIWGPRGFHSVQESDKTIISNWNSVVQPGDIVYHLGDVMLGDNEHGLDCLRQLNGEIHIIRGNHDTNVRWGLYAELENVVLEGWATMIKYKKYNFYLSHFPTETSNFDDMDIRRRIINLCGHTHQKNNFYNDKPYIYHVGVDSHNNTPVLLDTVIDDINNSYL